MAKCSRVVDNSVAVFLQCGQHYNINCYDTQLHVLVGECHVNGSTLSPSSPPVNVSSLAAHSRLSLNTRTPLSDNQVVEALRNTPFLAEDEIGGNVGAVLVVKQSLNSTTELLRATYKRLWSGETDEKPIVELGYFQLYAGLKRALQIGNEWASAVKSICSAEEPCRVAICGPKNAGKSTLCRYTVNRLLESHRAVLFLETDIGQSELTPAGLVTLSLVKQPLLNPPYGNCPRFVPNLSLEVEHCTSLSYCIGTVSPGQVMSEYMSKVGLLINAGKELCCTDVPLVLNNMGWTKGFGVALHADILRSLQPTHILNLLTGTSKDLPPIPDLLTTPGILADSPALITQPSILDLPGHSSPVDTTTVAPFQAFELRHLSLLGYFSPVYHAGGIVPPYKVSWDEVAAIIPETVEKEHAAFTLNCSVVALLLTSSGRCSPGDQNIRVIEETEEMCCLGYGIVRAVDVKERVFYLNTPVDQATLELVNVFKHTSLSVPHIPAGTLPVPYLNNLAASEIMGIGSRSQRANLKRRYQAIAQQ